MLSNRLTLAASLYTPCDMGADIGTDHAFLPCHLLVTGVCERMLLSDLSPKALARARAEVQRRGLEGRTELVCAPGLEALRETACGCVSITGMGGETIADILRKGTEWLRGAALILSPQTEYPLVRRAALEIGYRPEQERLTRDDGRFYQVWRYVPGPWNPGEEALRYGSLLYSEEEFLLRAWLERRVSLCRKQLNGLRTAAAPDEQATAQAEGDLRFYEHQLGRRS
ncbi:MAG: SAM-dependent methyltransferase [Clostridia bacterium]|nr:SAM-dependent methyltransferase [Clostridia bacterium]